MKKVIVTTTINPLTEAILRFERLEDWDLIVVDDKKTTPDYALQRGVYVTPEMQEEYDRPLSEAMLYRLALEGADKINFRRLSRLASNRASANHTQAVEIASCRS